MNKTSTCKALLSVLCVTVLHTHAQVQQGGDIDGQAGFDRSGWSVSMPDANTVAIGAPYSNGGAVDAGQTRIVIWNGSAWVLKGASIDGEASGDQSGYSVSMPDANTVAIGAPFNDGNGSGAGHVRVFAWNGSAWLQKGSDIDGEDQSDFSGWSVSMPDDNTVAIGAYSNDGNGSNAGHVRIFSWNGSTWVQRGTDIDGEATNDNSGYSISMPDANTVAIGARLNDGSASDAGHVRVYFWNGSLWVKKGIDMDGEAANDHSGIAVSMPDVNTVAIGATGNDGSGSNAGHVRIYSWSGSAWMQSGTDIDGEFASDESGTSVSMPDHNTIAIGAPGNNGNWTGQVRIYSWSGSAWTQMGTDIDGEAANDASGISVSMPDAGNGAIGAYLNDDAGTDAGHVRVYTSIPTGLEENDFERGVLIYPNPAGEFVVISSEFGVGDKIRITDVSGKEIFTKIFSAPSSNFELSTLNYSSGIYFLEINNVRKKFVKE